MNSDKYLLNSKYPQYYFGKVCVIIPCMDRADYLETCLRAWLSQSYQRYELIIVDYNSTEPINSTVIQVADKFNVQVDIEPTLENRYKSYNKISLFRLSFDTKVWNICHALNYGIRHSTSDVISIAGCDSLPDPKYLELAMSLVSDTVCPSVWCGRITFPRKYWYEINGFQEFCKNWGFEDQDFRGRLSVGPKVDLYEINQILCPSISHVGKLVDQQSAKWESRESNRTLCYDYYQKFGFIGNYCLSPGGDKPLDYQFDTNEFVIYVAKLKKPISETTHITTRCCYAGKIDSTTVLYFIPKIADEIIFSEEVLQNIDSMQSVTVSKTIWQLFEEMHSGTILSNF